MKTVLAVVAVLLLVAWAATRPVTGPEWLLMQLGCSDLARLNQRAKFDCWTMLQFGRVLNVPEAPQESCSDPTWHQVGNHRCCRPGYHSNDGGASNVCYKD